MKNNRKPRILNVDDDDAGRYTITRILRQAGFEVQEAATGREALRLAEECPDLILLDVNLPDISGFEVCRQIRANRRTAAIPVVHLSATFVGGDDRAAGLEQGADGYLTQPVEPKVLVATINAFLRLKAAEQALRESEERFRTALKNSPVIVFNQDRELRYTWIYNPQPGFKPETILGKTDADLLAAEEAARLTEIKRRVLETGVPAREEVRTTIGGQVFFYDLTTEPLLDASGDIVGVSSVSVDVTERQSATKALIGILEDEQRARASLLESEANFRQSLDESPLGIRIVSKEGETLYANRAILDIFGYDSIEEWQTTPTVKRYTEQSYAEFKVRREKRRLDQDDSPEYEIDIVKKDGEVRRLQVWRKRVLWNGKERFQAIYRDITERKREEEERKRLQAQLIQAQKMESVGRLAGGVAHDFNNMLGVILGHAEMAMEKVGLLDPVQSDLEEICKAAKRSADLTRHLLAFARKEIIRPQVLDLNDTVTGMLKMLRRLIGEDIHLAWMPGGDLWPVKMDPAQIDQILANLCVNARDAIVGVGEVTIEMQNVVIDETYAKNHAGIAPGGYVMLSVSDDGCGMDKETLEHLFERFFTTKEVGKGTGLGLATVYGIVKQNEGFINVYSEPGQGTTLKLYFPKTTEAVEAKPEPAAKMPATGTETVLLVEDEESILMLGKTILERFGYTVLPSQTPKDAITLAGRHEGPIHLLVTDVVMPGMNGRQLKECIEKIKPGIKALYMSGYTANVILHRGILEHEVHFIQKPFSINSLAGKVREVLDQYECLRDPFRSH